MESDSARITVTSKDATEEPEKKGESKIALYAAVLGNIAVGIVKFIAAGISGSSAMVSEGIHSIVDSGNGILILFGISKSKHPADEEHPFGYGKELYFWTLVVSILIFSLGGGMSIAEGIKSTYNALTGFYEFGNPTLNYVVIILGGIIEGTTLGIAVKQFNLARGNTSVKQFIEEAKDPSLYSVVLEDTAAELGLLFAFIGVFLTDITHIPYFDCGASIVIGLLLVCVAFILLRESKGLLLGEGMKHSELLRVRNIVESHPEVVACGRILTSYFGPDDLLIALDVTFNPRQDTIDTFHDIDELESAIKKEFPEAKQVFIELESFSNTYRQRKSLERDDNLVFEEEELQGANLSPTQVRKIKKLLRSLPERDTFDSEYLCTMLDKVIRPGNPQEAASETK